MPTGAPPAASDGARRATVAGLAAALLALSAPDLARADPATLAVHRGAALVRIDALADDLVRIRIAPDGRLPEDASWSVPPAVRAARAAHAHDASTTAVAGLATPALSVRIDRATLAVSVVDAAGRPILAEAPRGGLETHASGGFTLREALAPDVHVFALGDKTGPLERTGRSFVDWSTDTGVNDTKDPIYKAIPFMIGASKTGAWGLLLDNSWRAGFDFGHREAGVMRISADGGPVDLYLIAAPTVAGVVTRYADLTGKPPMPGKWALGYQQSRYSYMSADEVRAIAGRLRADRFPADVIWLDIDYQDRNRPFTTNPQTFPDMARLVRDLKREGIKLVAITDLHVAKAPDQGYAPYDTGTAQDVFVHAADGSVFTGIVWPGPSVFPDFTDAKARRWWGDQYRTFVQDGVAGFWNDMNEPSVFDTPTHTIPLDALQRIDSDDFAPRTTTHAEVHNLTGLLNTRATFEGLQRLAPDSRPFVMTRSTAPGGQKFAATWTGDNDATWSGLKLGVAQTLNLGMSGFAWTAVDVGGFHGGAGPDLLTKWFEVQAFMPLMREHTQKDAPRAEPWVDGPAQEAVRRRFVEARYRLLPYLYALADEAHRTGAPIARPVFYADPAMLETPCDTSMSWTLGRDLLVAANPQPESPYAYDACLPKGVWYDWWTGTPAGAFTTAKDAGGGGLVVNLTPSPDTLPVFVRAGAIIPTQPLVQSTAQTPSGPLSLDIWPGDDCRGTIYDDDGETQGFARGAYLRQEVRCKVTSAGLEVAFGAREGRWRPWWRELRVTVHAWKGAGANVSGAPVTSDVDRHTASFTLADPPPAGATVRIAGAPTG